MSKRLRAAIRASNRGRTLRPKGVQGRPSSPSLDFDDAEQGEALTSDPGVAITEQDDALATDSAKGLTLPPMTPEPSSPDALAPVALPEAAPVQVAPIAPVAELEPALVAPMTAAPFESAEPSSPAETLRDLQEVAHLRGDVPVEAASEPPPEPEVGPKSAPELAGSHFSRLAGAAPHAALAASTLDAIAQPAPAARPARSEAAVDGEMAAASASTSPKTSLDEWLPAAKPAKVEAAEAPISVRQPVKVPESVRVEGPKSGSKSLMDDELDGSSVSAEFFQQDTGAAPPAVELHHEVDEIATAPVLSPTALARRARFRRVVAGVVAFAGVLSLAVVGKTLAASTKSSAPATRPAAPLVVMQETKQEIAPAMDARLAVKAPEGPAKAVPEAAKVEEAKGAAEPAKVEEAKGPNEPAKVEDVKAEAKTEEAKAEAPKAEAPKAEVPAADTEALKKETLKLLDRGKMKEAIEKAKEAIAADPADAISYLYLGSALQETGKWKDGVEAYCECVRHATKGPVNECRQMGGHK